jgi:hypothetical protein
MRINATILCALPAIVWLGAATFPDYPSRSPRECAVWAESGGVVVGVQPMREPADQQTYFHMKLKGLVPVFIAIQNGSKEDSFIFDKTAIKSGSAATGVASPNVTKSLGQLGAGVLVSPLFISHDFKNQQNLLKQEVQSTTLSPGASTHGFLYLPVAAGSAGQKMQLRVALAKAGSHETSFIDLNF